MAKYATKGPATSSEDIVVSLKPRTIRKRTTEIKTKRMKESHRLDEVLEQRGRLTIGELCDETGYSLSRVLEHVNYIIDIGIAKLLKSPKKQTSSRRLIGEPQEKVPAPNRGLHGIAKHVRGGKDGEPPLKHQIFEIWLKDPVAAQRNVDKIAEKFGPKPTLQTIRSWMSNWRQGLVDEKRGGFYPPSLRGREDELTAALKKLKAAESATHSRAGRQNVSPEDNFSGELPDDETFIEGAVSQVLVNRYERDPKARANCLKEFGHTCKVCGANFGKLYGEIGDGFIHVHHRKPLALRKAEYHLNPIKDLVPVCPNCHAMLHTCDPPLEIDELRKLMKSARGATTS